MKDDVLSIIIVNWNSCEFLKNCLSSICSNIKGTDFEVIVVDNASFDGSAGVSSLYAPAKFIQLKENNGFSYANNVGLRQSRGTIVWFLNPDTLLFPETYDSLYTVMESDAAIGAVGARLLNGDGTLQTSAVLPFPTIINQLFDIEVLKVRTPWIPYWGIGALYTRDTVPCDVEAVSGASILTRRAVMDTVGGFSEEYFMYAEDIDLCTKIRRAGFRVVFSPASPLTHFGGGSSRNERVKARSITLMRHSNYLLVKKYKGRAYATMFHLSTVAAAAIRLALMITAYPFLSVLGKKTAVHNALFKWCTVLGWSLRKGFKRL